MTACNPFLKGGEGTTGGATPAVKKPVSNKPNVFVNDDKYLVIDQEPIHIKIKKSAGSATYDTVGIQFTLDNSLTNYIFDPEIPSNPLKITLKGGTTATLTVLCSVNDPKTMVCNYNPTDKGGYNYTLRVRNTATSTPTFIVSDPSIVND